MIIQFECEHCNHLMTVPIELQGRSGHCAKCYAPIKVPFASQVIEKKRGIGRLTFVLLITPILTLYPCAAYLSGLINQIPYHMIYILAAFPLLAYTPLRYRHRNLGYTSSSTQKILIPVYNLYLIWRGTVYPKGYAAHQTPDRTGVILKIITAFLVSPLLFFSSLAAFKLLYDRVF